ncbi:hypothetical protein [Stutzerimonas nitrititolerans]|uniref:hypothetical protein n=1 Tax=Stutzerimonas nitrititolerans TaxID=2482751 RepID=UPI0028A77368|nr:hypothetical protein [Stutzerimonas nitrititolerans]
MASSSNFAFLQEHNPIFLQLASTAEQVFASDPNTTLIKLRQLGEALAQDLASRAGIEFDEPHLERSQRGDQAELRLAVSRTSTVAQYPGLKVAS